MRRRFNDGYYAVPVEEWEEQRIPQVLMDKRVTWTTFTAIVGWIAVGQFVSNRGWQFWVGYALSVYLVSTLFVLIDEVNENVRYVRHQLRAFREAVGETNTEVGNYKQPHNATVRDILDTLDRTWFP